jgi:hypothetical protein
MENKDTKYKTDSKPDDFIKFLFGEKPQQKNTIKLEIDPPERNKHIGLHIFQQLLQIFVDGLRYLYGDDGKVDIQKLSEENIQSMTCYFSSIGYKLVFETFDRSNYEPKPNVFMDHKLIKSDTSLNEFYYELMTENEHKMPIVYRVSFKFIQ